MKYFGTDGIRGNAKELFTYELSYRIGFFLGRYQKSNKLVVGYDTRESGPTIAKAIIEGVKASGGAIIDIAVIPTPAIAYIVQKHDFDYGIMISASHNPYVDNGIKIFDRQGYKISPMVEKEIERFIDGEIKLYPRKEKVAAIQLSATKLRQDYINYLRESFISKQKFNLLIDAANGSASAIIDEVLSGFPVEVTYINKEPNGVNINLNGGSTDLTVLQDLIKAEPGKYDYGVAFDGDADRVLFVDAQGEVLDGDHIMFLLGKYYKDKGLLHQNTVVLTLMANYGLFKALKQHDIKAVVTDVGDKYIQREIIKNDYTVGGEQSGHIIFNKIVKSGDGIFTMLEILNILSDVGVTFNEYTRDFKKYPQILLNIAVSDKQKVLGNAELEKAMAVVHEKLDDSGRLLVRASGTENLIRVMVEAQDQEVAHRLATGIIEVIKKI
ncbi:MAG TPA: phosphoglucosamine mutase [Bacilli bacterium]|nr:phosphoglucosamine mutase [Bacilli bacterium]